MEQGPADIALVQEPWIASGNSVAANLLYSTSHGRPDGSDAGERGKASYGSFLLHGTRQTRSTART
ncbi:uncharacterized protein LOC117186416 isoform X2 [Drosophila miranda]|uniref:uncharacterized protein LOC117186416 isoform X2 n=1 Tax=Drosophila miranda TaxID=7229 RepID=UPI00143FA320|nr:uncharacterized protein LOC117186416 isoform X2 [Drosophila miranda]